MSDHPDLEKLDPSVRDIVREVFRDPANGTPDDISKAGCLALAKHGHEVWNAWRSCFSSRETKVVNEFVNFADFSNLRFEADSIDFSGFHFGKGANFSKTKFTWRQHFENCFFDNVTNFSDATFGSMVYFNGSVFGNVIWFNNVDFGEFASFVDTTFNGNVRFESANFKYAWFRGVVFSDNVVFINSSFKERTDFGVDERTGAVFKRKALFQGASINQSFDLRFAIFPIATGEPDVSESYRTLKLAYSNIQAVKEEQRFFRMEMSEEAVRATGFERYLYGRYKAFSDYGFSVVKPLWLLTWMLFAFLFVYGIVSVQNCKPDYCQFSSAWIEFALVQALPLPGLDKLSESLRDALYPRQGGWSVFVTTAVILHKAISLLALFLIGLGLRNLFKLK